MKIRVTKFKSLKVALKELQRFISDAAPLLRGKPLERFGHARPRELLGNWLLAAVANAETGSVDYTFTSDPMEMGSSTTYARRGTGPLSTSSCPQRAQMMSTTPKLEYSSRF